MVYFRFLINMAHLPGTKVLIGDNLPSHFSSDVIEKIQKHSIRFATMPANSTHLCQPLDVAVFGPTKRVRRKIPDKWQKETCSEESIPKSQFPSMFRKLCNRLLAKNHGVRFLCHWPLSCRLHEGAQKNPWSSSTRSGR